MLDIKKLLARILAQITFVMQEHTVSTSVTVNSGASANLNYTVSKSGYYPLGIVGWRLANGNGSGGSYGLPFGLRLTSASNGSAGVYIGLRAADGKVNSCTLYVTILWRKVGGGSA